ncbi:MAG: YggS family pyridoxal phosphate-dependent enzyme [SAR86 cluster bacterium]|uniref:Pyridoxal phosphate homeostasis protein n=1 Tax=SAR86 cluster bacterium TaxID=2030880 RepID=A0A937HZN6_9GAMM|nr:YggS family pyridoxal phosphate-dependent enzyme [SAR86 cluster bacterium]
MESIEDKIKIVQSKIDAAKTDRNVKLVAVSKKKSWQDILEAYKNGISDFGENYLQESLEKISKLKDLKINWHFIGNIQSNKCEEIAKNFDWIHTIDRLKIARLIDKYCPEDKCIKCLIQINIDNEESKSGIKFEEVENFLNEIRGLNKIKLCGLMIIPNPNLELSDLQQAFKKIKMLSDRLIENYENLTEISMGMSRDFELAIKEGSTIVRLGETIFGARN